MSGSVGLSCLKCWGLLVAVGVTLKTTTLGCLYRYKGYRHKVGGHSVGLAFRELRSWGSGLCLEALGSKSATPRYPSPPL